MLVSPSFFPHSSQILSSSSSSCSSTFKTLITGRDMDMAKQQVLVRQGVLLRLPPGFRFRPTDEELVLQYLRRKIYACPLPASIIPEIDLGSYDPWELPGGSKEAKYFFNLREGGKHSSRSRAAGSGYWRAEGKEKQVMASKCGEVVGMKKVLVFHRGKKRAARTDWIMHEYYLVSPENQTGASPQANPSRHSSAVSRGDWVLCRIFKKKRATKKVNEAEEDEHKPCSESSCVTQLSDESSDGEEASSSSPTRA